MASSRDHVLVNLEPKHIPLLLEVCQEAKDKSSPGSYHQNQLREIGYRLERTLGHLMDEGILNGE